METIGNQSLWTFIGRKDKIAKAQCLEIRESKAAFVSSFAELVEKVAELQFRNRDYLLLYRGQNHDFRNQRGRTTLKPTIFRPRKGIGLNPSGTRLQDRFSILAEAEVELVSKYETHGFPGLKLLQRQRILRWSILQHYEVCRTPLLDVTHSLRIAASFASDSDNKNGYIFVVGVPNLSGVVTASAEAGLQIVRLAGVCPPQALRPHFQEGYLLGEYPELGEFLQKQLYSHYEVDFGRRLVAKFKFRKSEFWENSVNFPMVDREALYPDHRDELLMVCDRVKGQLRREVEN